MNLDERIQDREFQIWDFWVSHSQLLLRSPKNTDAGLLTNVDLKFLSVEYIDFPTRSCKLLFNAPTAEDRTQVEAKFGRRLYEDEKLFAILCEQNRHFIVALNVAIEENDLDIFDSTLQRKW